MPRVKSSNKLSQQAQDKNQGLDLRMRGGKLELLNANDEVIAETPGGGSGGGSLVDWHQGAAGNLEIGRIEINGVEYPVKTPVDAALDILSDYPVKNRAVKLELNNQKVTFSDTGSATAQALYATQGGVERRLGQTISVSATGTATDEIGYITVDGVEHKVAPGLGYMTTDTLQDVEATAKKFWKCDEAYEYSIRTAKPPHSGMIDPSTSFNDLRPDGLNVQYKSIIGEITRTHYGQGAIITTGRDEFYQLVDFTLTLPTQNAALATVPDITTKVNELSDQIAANYVKLAGDEQTITGQKVFNRDDWAIKVRSVATPTKTVVISPETVTLGYYPGDNTTTSYKNGSVNRSMSGGATTYSYDYTWPDKSGTVALTNDLAETVRYDNAAITFQQGLHTFVANATYTSESLNHMIVQVATDATIIPTPTYDSGVVIGTLTTTKNVAHTMGTGVVYSRTLGHFVACNIEVQNNKNVVFYYQTYMGVVDGIRANVTARIW